VLSADERNVGILLPPSVPAVVVNAALTVDRRVAVNLNYTVSGEIMNHCIAQAGIRHVLTSRRFLERFDFKPEAELILLEELKDRVNWRNKAAGMVDAWMTPVAALEKRLRLTEVAPGDLMTLIFTSGSTGWPKGVMLSQENVRSNVEAFQEVLNLTPDDVLVGVLPFFHSFGYTTTMWSALMLDARGVYHYSPLEPRAIGKLCREHRGTIFVATPTFLRSYIRRCEPEDFNTLDVVITGAERLPSDVADAFERRFGVRPYEGYGTTELSPVVSVNIPPSRTPPGAGTVRKEGTVGKPVPGVAVKTVDLETGRDLSAGQAGMLLVKGPNVMQGYLDQPQQTAEVMRGEWYVTGDVAVIDSEGFIRITGRESRFSKIGGEMVPHLRIEEALVEVLSLDAETQSVVVTALPDLRKGERLIVLHTGLGKPAEQVCRELAATGLPPIWVPSPDSFCQIDEIPVLGTGKLDLKRVRELAAERMAVRT
jgi:acyl-[acyl-carrier-protein]-phospholipid O-acyltransferase/long-chain-fatty-acid--[acyl-carrier-protein] ligase